MDNVNKHRTHLAFGGLWQLMQLPCHLLHPTMHTMMCELLRWSPWQIQQNKAMHQDMEVTPRNGINSARTVVPMHQPTALVFAINLHIMKNECCTWNIENTALLGAAPGRMGETIESNTIGCPKGQEGAKLDKHDQS